MLAMMYVRQSKKSTRVTPLTSEQHSEYDAWLRDMFSLLGFVCHDMGARSGSPRVEKYDALLALELIQYEHDLGVGKFRHLLELNDDVPELQVFQQLVLTFGMVSDVGDDSKQTKLLDRYMMFGHRTFQEFLTARALIPDNDRAPSPLRSPAHLESVPSIEHFDWQSGSVLANQWFDQVFFYLYYTVLCTHNEQSLGDIVCCFEDGHRLVIWQNLYQYVRCWLGSHLDCERFR